MALRDTPNKSGAHWRVTGDWFFDAPADTVSGGMFTVTVLAPSATEAAEHAASLMTKDIHVRSVERI